MVQKKYQVQSDELRVGIGVLSTSRTLDLTICESWKHEEGDNELN